VARSQHRRSEAARQRVEEPALARPEWVVPVLGAVFLLSGGAGLVHEVVWARLLGHVFGATSLAIATVLAAFMGGLALGSWWMGRRPPMADRRRLYAFLEVGIGLSALALPFLLGLVEPLYAWIWREFQFSFAVFSVLRFFLAGGLLLPPTIMMGATLPALADYLAGLRGRRIGAEWLYTLNLAGAALGAAAAGFVLMPTLGVWGTVVAGASLNLAIGALVLLLPRLSEPPRLGPRETAPLPSTLFLTAAFVSGFLSLATQVAWTRVLVLIVGSTTYAFSAVLLVYLVALGAGSAWASRRGARTADVRPLLGLMQLLMAAAMLGAVYAVNQLPFWYVRLVSAWEPASLAGAIGLNVCVIFGILFLPVLFAGTVLPLVLVGALPPSRRGTGAIVGTLYGVNTVGAILGAVLGGFVLVPLVGSARTLTGVCVVGAAMGVVFLLAGERTPWRVGVSIAGATLVLAGALARPDWQPGPLNAGVYEHRRMKLIENMLSGRNFDVVYNREGPTATVVVALWKQGQRALIINGRPNASDNPADMPTQVMMAAAPLFLAPRTQDVLVIGWGSGASAGTALRWPIRRVTAIELEPAVIEASRLFEHINYQALDDARLRLFEDDARHMLLASEDTYDVILSEPSHPWVTGVSNLFTREFFQLARVRLRADGVFAQWVQAYEISFETFRVILATFQSVFPEVVVFVPPGTQDCILVGSRRPLRLDLAELDRRWAQEGPREEANRIGLARPEALLAVLYLGPEAVRTMVQGAPLNTDDNMYVEFNGPRGMIQATPPGGRVIPRLEDAAVPIETMLTEPALLLRSRERLGTYIDGLETLERSADRYRKLLDDLG